MKKKFIEDENVILISVKTQKQEEKDVLSSLNELKNLIRLCNGRFVDQIVQKMEKVNFYHYIGSGKLEELRNDIETFEASVIIADDELSYVQIKNLQDTLGVKVIDRTSVILEVFSKGVKTKETKLLLELTKLRYRISRGNDEKKEYLKERLKILQDELEEFNKHHLLLKENRRKSNIPTIAIVGYSNVGKSTLLNKLSGSDIYTEDKLFATMDTTTRIVKLPSGGEVLFTDTVGFIRKLPKDLIRLFHLSLEEIKNADIILHVIDISSKDFKRHRKVVKDTLDLLGVADKKVIDVFNKVDLVKEQVNEDREGIFISVETDINLDSMLFKLEDVLRDRLMKMEFVIPYEKVNLLSIIYDNGEDILEEYRESGIFISGYFLKSFCSMIL